MFDPTITTPHLRTVLAEFPNASLEARYQEAILSLRLGRYVAKARIRPREDAFRLIVPGQFISDNLELIKFLDLPIWDNELAFKRAVEKSSLAWETILTAHALWKKERRERRAIIQVALDKLASMVPGAVFTQNAIGLLQLEAVTWGTPQIRAQVRSHGKALDLALVGVGPTEALVISQAVGHLLQALYSKGPQVRELADKDLGPVELLTVLGLMASQWQESGGEFSLGSEL